MSVKSELNDVKAALRDIGGLTVVTAWPKETDVLPCALVSLAGETGVDYRDDVETVTEIEWYVRLFATREAEMMALCENAQAQMEGLGYRRTFRYEEGDGNVRQTVYRFAKLI